MTRPQSPESTLLPFAGDILSISRSGELAILQSLRPVGRGILATVPMAGGPRGRCWKKFPMRVRTGLRMARAWS